MPRSGSGSIVIHFPQVIGIYINGIDYTDYAINYEFKEQLNKTTSFFIDLVSITSDERTDVAEGNDVQLRFANNLKLKGRIDKANYKSYEFCTIEGFGTVETILKNTPVEWRAGKCSCDENAEVNKPIYSGTTSGVATTVIVQGQLSGVSTVSINTNEYLGHLVARSENDNVLSFLTGMAGNMSGVWWSSYGNYPYTSNYFNIGKAKGSGSSVFTFNTTGVNQNADETSREVDEDALWNSVTLLGYGDGINQLKSKVYHATDNFTRLLSGCTADDTILTVENISVLDSSGTLWVGMEQVDYTGKTGSIITGCTRATKDTTDSNDQKYLKAYAHSKGVVAYDVDYTENSTDGNSKIDDDGLQQRTIPAKEIVNQDALDQSAINLLLEHYIKKERIKLIPSDLYACLSGISVGDVVSVTDSESGLSGGYTVVGQVLKINEGYETLEYELSNSSSTFTQDLSTTQETIKVGSQYMQGSTTAFNVQSYENCDASNPLNLKVYLPDDLIRVNKALLSFDVKDYRSYTAASDTSDTSVVTEIFTVGSDSISFTANDWITLSTETPTNETDFLYYGVNVYGDEEDGGFKLRIRIYDGTTYYPAASGMQSATGLADSTAGDSFAAQSFMLAPVNVNGKTITFQAVCDTTGSYSTNWQAYSIGKHIHDMDYSITTSGVATQTVDLSIGPEGSEGIVDTGMVSGVAYDITDWIVSGIDLSTGNWRNIQITPVAGNPVRIEANLYMKTFIEAK